LKRKFVTNLALLLFLNLLVKPFWIFGIDRTVQNIVGAGEYGFYFSLLNFSLILNVILDIGVTNYNNRNISQHSFLLSKYLSNIIILKFILAVAYAIISIGLALLIGYDSRQLHLLFLLIFNQFLISFTLFLRSNISGLQLFRTDSFLSVLDKALMIVFCSALLWGRATGSVLKIEHFVYAQTAAYLISTFAIFLIVQKHTGVIKYNFNIKYILAIVKQTMPYALLVLIMASYSRIDSVLLERMLVNGTEQAGIYAQAFRILDAASMFGFLFAALLLPMFSKMIKIKEPVNQLVQLSTLLILVPVLLFSISSLFYKTEIMGMLYNEHVQTSSTIFALLMFSFVSISVTYIFGTLLTANGNLKQLNIIAASGLLINVVMNIVLIPKLSATGSAYASLFTQTVTAFAQLYFACRVFGFKINYPLIFKIFGFILFVFVINYLSLYLTCFWVIKFVIVLASGFIIAFISRLISLKNIYRIVFDS